MENITTREQAIEILEKTERPVAPGRKCTIDRFMPEDAWGVIRCCYSIYGGGYPIDAYYIPDKLIAENQNGNIFGVVARTVEGEITGYGALYRSSAWSPKVYETGQYIVRKEYRNTRIAYELYNFINTVLIDEIDLDAMFGEPVCKHLVTQKMGVRAGYLETGVELELMPAEAYETDANTAGRVSALLMLKVVRDMPHDIYLPEIYKEIVTRCTDSMRLARKIKPTAAQPFGMDGGLSSCRYHDHAEVGRLSIARCGSETARVVSDFESRAFSKNYKVLQVYLNIGEPAVGSVFEELLGKGYFFGAYLPRWFGTDGFLLQKLAVEPDLDSILLYSEWAKKLLAFTLKDRGRAGK